MTTLNALPDDLTLTADGDTERLDVVFTENQVRVTSSGATRVTSSGAQRVTSDTTSDTISSFLLTTLSDDRMLTSE